ncbi:hypothetical protein CEXT_220351 [Caerostris extrusa]|uniref:Uncharacterized protein n=1 Tax=Caerostris extrusa TaxID=172846 RepID=A0AAV4PX75_CAEEX|nr:hypothetical protein CEXT_220351 [Caerostris extrusa]
MDTLYESCLLLTCELLREGYVNRYPVNPFCRMSEEIVQDVFCCYVDFPMNGFKAIDINLLLTSGRLMHVAFVNIPLGTENIDLLRLMLGCRGLKSVTLVNTGIPPRHSRKVTKQLEKFLTSSAASSLEQLHTSIPFDLRVLRGCTNLHDLKLHFVPRQPLSDILIVENFEKKT